MNTCKYCGKPLTLTPEFDTCMECQGRIMRETIYGNNGGFATNSTKLSMNIYDEALNCLNELGQETNEDFKGFIIDCYEDYYFTIEKALTELKELKRYPTSEEVCKALSEYFKDVINYDWTLGFTKGKNKKLIYWYENDELEIYDKLPPHLITLIGRFYEGLK